jgi:spore maturation protein CgeB
MKMIYVGSLMKTPDRDSGWIRSFEELGCAVVPFSSHIHYPKVGLVKRIWNKMCNRFNIGFRNKEMQKSLLLLAEQEFPEWVHIQLPLGFDKKTIKALQNKNIFVTEYFNDDAFSKKQPFGAHWKFRNTLKLYDGHFVWRARDIEVYKRVGASHVEHSPPYYDPERVFISTPLEKPAEFLADAAFMGHWEDDWRVDCLDALSCRGLDVIIRGGPEGWETAIKGREIGKLSPIKWADDTEYRRVYSNVVAGLCFFSKINNDEWTRRAFEIVALGGVLVCERTNEASNYFKDREEAFFFSSIDELIEIVCDLKENTNMRESVRVAGHKRLLEGGNSILERAEQVYQFVLASTLENGVRK